LRQMGTINRFISALSAFLVFACMQDAGEKEEKDSYVYSGDKYGRDIVIDEVDTTLCLKTTSVIGSTLSETPIDTIQSNTCDYKKALEGAFHQMPMKFLVSHDTLDTIDRVEYQRKGFVLIEWPLPKLDSNWIKEYNGSTSTTPEMSWSENSLKIRINLGSAWNSVELSESDKLKKQFSYILRFDRISRL
jgi:hypothetical protein